MLNFPLTSEHREKHRACGGHGVPGGVRITHAHALPFSTWDLQRHSHNKPARPPRGTARPSGAAACVNQCDGRVLRLKLRKRRMGFTHPRTSDNTYKPGSGDPSSRANQRRPACYMVEMCPLLPPEACGAGQDHAMKT